MQTSSSPNVTTPTLTLVEQVQVRRDELTRGLTADSNSKSTRADIEGALAALTPMLTGDLATLPDMVRRDLSRWLEASKYLGMQTASPAAKAEVEDAARPSVAAMAAVTTAAAKA